MSNTIKLLNHFYTWFLVSRLDLYPQIRLWIEDGRVTGWVNESTGELHKENPHTDR